MSLKHYLESLGRYAAVQGLLIAVLLALSVLCAGFAVTALIIWLAGEVGVAAAFAIVAAGALAAALLVQLAIVLHRRKRAAQPSLFGDKDRSNQAALGSIAALAVIGYLLGRRTDRHPGRP